MSTKHISALILVTVFLFGCAGRQTHGRPTENVSDIINGSWSGYIQDNPYTHLGFRTPKLDISILPKEDGGWNTNILLNRKTPAQTSTDVYNGGVSIEIMEVSTHSNLIIWYKLNLTKINGEYYLVGGVYFGTKSYTPAQVTFKKT